METMEKKLPCPQRSFTPEFKVEVVALVQHGGKTVGAVARELDLTETAVRASVKHAELDAGTRCDGLTTAELAELAELPNLFAVPVERSSTSNHSVTSQRLSWPISDCALPPQPFHELQRSALGGWIMRFMSEDRQSTN
jgi:transposase